MSAFGGKDDIDQHTIRTSDPRRRGVRKAD
jgi:hypothetical protein